MGGTEENYKKLRAFSILAWNQTPAWRSRTVAVLMVTLTFKAHVNIPETQLQ
jgi:hypothetical protein